MLDDFIPSGRGRLKGRDRGPVAQDGDPIADREDLFQLVRDVDAGDAPRLEFAEDREQQVDLVVGEGGGRGGSSRGVVAMALTLTRGTDCALARKMTSRISVVGW